MHASKEPIARRTPAADQARLQDLRRRVEQELCSNILPFWLKYAIDAEFGGFRGQITNDLVIDPLAPKGLILNARILWTFSKAYSVYGQDVYLEAARRAYDYIVEHFWDAEFGGVYWMLDHRGRPVDRKKRIYGQAFTIYALAEYHSATAEADSLERATRLYQIVESRSHDPRQGGYFETYERDWALALDQRLSEVDLDEKRSMNTHLHMLEAYASLMGGWNDEGVKTRLKELIQIFLDHIIASDTHHCRLFFDEGWRPKSDVISFGHDIEGSWLLCEAAETLGEQTLLGKVQREAVRMAQAVFAQAVDSDGSLWYEADGNGRIDSDKHWWVQSEAVVGFLNAYERSGQREFLTAAERSWDFIENYIVDRKDGEWFWKVSREGIPSGGKYKVDAWKCPYHNSRTCFEVMARVGRLG